MVSVVRTPGHMPIGLIPPGPSAGRSGGAPGRAGNLRPGPRNSQDDRWKGAAWTPRAGAGPEHRTGDWYLRLHPIAGSRYC